MSRKKKATAFGKCLNTIERIGNALPHPVTLFAMLALAVILLSAMCEALGVSATGELVSGGLPTQTTVTAVSLLSREGLRFLFTGAVNNFTSYASLGMVLVAMLGVGVAEQSGLMDALLKKAVSATPPGLLTAMIVFLGVLSNIASDAGYVVLIPLGAMMFQACGRHPMAGLAAAFAGVSGGFSANLLIGTLDPMLAGITQSAAHILDSGYQVQIMGNYIFMIVSTFLITFLGTLVTEKVVEPRLGSYAQDSRDGDRGPAEITAIQKKGLRNAGIAALIYLGLITALCIPGDSFFRSDTGELLGSTPLVNSLILLISLLFLIPGVAYGKTVGTFQNDREIADALGKSMSDMGGFLALAFVSAQFINYFAYTNLGTILALSGAAALKAANIGLIPLILIFVLFSAFLNLFMGSASAKWNIMAPVFVPMFMLLGYSPELCQLAYRVGDSCTNVITPLMTYYALILTYARKYDKDAGIGTITATMLPYSMAFLVGWTALLLLWLAAGLPIGIHTPLLYPAFA